MNEICIPLSDQEATSREADTSQFLGGGGSGNEPHLYCREKLLGILLDSPSCMDSTKEEKKNNFKIY